MGESLTEDTPRSEPIGGFETTEIWSPPQTADPSNRVVVAALVRNEVHRIGLALEGWYDFADYIIVLDDQSNDGTREEVLKFKGQNRLTYALRSAAEPMWGHENGARSTLWEMAYSATNPGDWIFVLDADMMPCTNPKPLFEVTSDGIAFRLFDLWGEGVYRSDQFWRAHDVPRLWAVRRPSNGFQPSWSSRGIHTGHFPHNINPNRILYAPHRYGLLHYAYATDAARRTKAQKYLDVSDQLSDFELQHARTILDPDPRVVPLPFIPEYEMK